MNVFQQVWQNFETYVCRYHTPQDKMFLNELNQAVFSRLEKKLPSCIKLRAVSTPTFVYHFQPFDGSAVDVMCDTVETYKVKLTEAKFEDNVESIVDQLISFLDSEDQAMFFYMPLYKLGNDMIVRLRTTDASVHDL